MEKMINSDKVSNEAKEKLRKAFDSSKYYSGHKIPYETKIKRHLTKRKIEYIYNNIHNMLDDKITFKLDDNDIKKINIINSLIDATNKEYEAEYKKEDKKYLFKGMNIFSNKAEICAHIIELLSNKEVMNIGGPNASLCISQIITDSTVPDKRLMVQGIPPKFINSEIAKLSKENISKEEREKAINDLRLSIIEYNMVKLPELVKEFNMSNSAIEQIEKALDIHYGADRKDKYKDNEVENNNNDGPIGPK